MAPSREQCLKTANKFLEGFNTFEPGAIISVSSPTCTYRWGPKCMEQTPKNNEELVGFVKAISSITPTFSVKLVEGEDIIVDTEARKVVMHLKSYAPTVAGVYANEYIFVVQLNEDGTLVENLLEFMDSLHGADMLPKMAKAIEEAAKKNADGAASA